MEWNGEEFWNCRSECVRLCLRISTADSGINQEICRQQRPKVQTFLAVTPVTVVSEGYRAATARYKHSSISRLLFSS